MDFTDIVILKTATKVQVKNIEARDSSVLKTFSRNDIELLKRLVVIPLPEARSASVNSLNWMPYGQLVSVLISLEASHPSELEVFLQYVSTQGFSSVSTLRKKLGYLVHALYFSDVFSDSKILN